MRSGAALVLVAALMSPARAQTRPTKPPVLEISPLRMEPEASLAPLRLDRADLERIETRARRRRAVGMGIAIPGVVFAVLGSVLIGAGTQNSRLAAGAAEIASGSVSAGLGVLLIGPGSYLWVTGQDSVDVAAWRRRRMPEPPTTLP